MPEAVPAGGAVAEARTLRRMIIMSVAVTTTAEVEGAGGDLVLTTRTITRRKFIMTITDSILMTTRRRRADVDLEGLPDLAVMSPSTKNLRRRQSPLCKSWLKSARDFTKKGKIRHKRKKIIMKSWLKKRQKRKPKIARNTMERETLSIAGMLTRRPTRKREKRLNLGVTLAEVASRTDLDLVLIALVQVVTTKEPLQDI
jgi:hypothetical protein